jgi:hypothetical protein
MVFVTGCGSLQPDDTPHPSKKGTLANEVTNRAFARLKIEKELYPFGTGAEMMYQIKMLALAFHYYKEVNIGEARELLISAGTTFLDIINSNEEIRPFLHNYPFNPGNVEIRIVLKSPNASEFSYEKLCIVTMIDGRLNYEARNPQTDRLLTIHKETYDEAISKLSSATTENDSKVDSGLQDKLLQHKKIYTHSNIGQL